METTALLKPLTGWYSSHWSIAPANCPTKPFTITSTCRVNQPLPGLQDLYTRAVFLLGITSDLLGKRPSTTGGTPPPETAKQAPVKSEEGANRPVPQTSGALQRGDNLKIQLLPAAGPVNLQRPPHPTALSSQPEPDIGSRPAPENLETLAAKAEVLTEAVNRLGAALETHEFLARSLTHYGTELISKFAQTLATYGLSGASGSVTVDREQLARAYQENPPQVTEAFCGKNSLTAEIASLATAIVGAPGAYLMEPPSPSPETYQPFQGANPWFRVAPALFWQVA